MENITGIDGGNRFYEFSPDARRVAWNTLGDVSTYRQSPSEVIPHVRRDLEMMQPSAMIIDGHTVPVEGKSQVLMVSPDGIKPLSEVSTNRFHLTDYNDFIPIFERVAEIHPVETCGLMTNGTMFIVFKGADFDVAGSDAHKMYYVANISVTPGMSTHIHSSPIRISCENMNSWAMRKATDLITIPHTTDTLRWMELATTVLTGLDKTDDLIKTVFNQLARHKVTDEEVQGIIESAHPTPKEPRKVKVARTHGIHKLNDDDRDMVQKLISNYERNLELAKSLQEFTLENYHRINEEVPAFAGSAYAVYNAVTEVADHRKALRGSINPESVMYGSRNKEKIRAFEASYALISN